MFNNLDNIEMNLNQLYKDVINREKNEKIKKGFFLFNKLKLIFSYLCYKLKLHNRLVNSGLSVNWLKEFLKFWHTILNGRPIDVPDFHYLRMNYRLRFQNIGIINEKDQDSFICTWQKPETMYLLLSTVYNYGRTNYLNFLPILKYLPKKATILEYGCGIAPITQGLIKYMPHRKYEFTILDILQINFLYAIFSLGKYENVNYRILDPFKNCINNKDKYNVIICQQVLEHLPNPLEVVKSFFQCLELNGLFIFDYIKGAGQGLDSMNSVRQRESVLQYILMNSKILYGKINANVDVKWTVVVKNSHVN